MKLLLPDKDQQQQKKDTLPILLPEGESLAGSEQLRKNIDMTKTVNPDTAAENQVLGSQTGLDSDFVARNHEQVKSEVEVDTIQSKVNNFPGVANYFSERKNVEVSKDDIDNLTETESLFKQYVIDPGSAVLKFAPRAAYTIEGSVSNILALPFGAMDEATKSLDQLTGFGRGGAFGNIRDMFQEHARNMFAQRDQFFAPSEEIRDQRLIENFGLLADPEWVLTNLGDTAASFLPVLVTALYTGGSSLAGGVVGGGMEGGALYNQMMDEGKVNSATALNAATIFGTASAYLNKIGLDKILDKTPVKGLKDRVFKAIVKGSVEGATEWLEEPTEALISTIAEGGDTEDVIEAVKEAAKNIEVIPGSFLLGGGTAYMHMGNEYRRIRSAETDAQFFEELDQKATDSKTKSRLPKSYEKAIEAIQREAGGEVENVYIDAVLFQKALDTQPEVSDEILDKIGLDNELTEALATGGDIAIPISKYATHIAGTDLSINIRPDIHFKQDGMSSREAETARTEWAENMQTQIDEIQSEKEAVDAFEAERQQVYEDVLQRREATGAVPETVESDAAYWAAFASTYAQRYGGTPMEVYRQITPEIRAEERFEGTEEGEFIDQEAQAEESFQTAQQDVQQIISREQAPVPSETVLGFAPEVDLAAQRLHDLQLSLQEGEIINFTDPSVLDDVLALAVDRVSGFREGRIGSARANTLKRAQDFVRQNPDIPANYVEIDLRNLGGINEEYGHTAADRIFRSITDIIAKNLNRLGVDNNDFRHGGDEVGSIIIGADAAAIDKVLFDAETEIAEMANNTITPSGTLLSELIHPKHKKDLTRRGTGIIFSSSPVDPDASVREIFEQADVDVELRKKGLDDEYNRQIEKARALASEGRRRFGRPITEEEIRAPQEGGREPEEEGRRRSVESRLNFPLFQTPLIIPFDLPVTLSIFTSPMLSNRIGKHVKVETVRQVLNQKTTKKIEKEIVEDVLSSEPFAGQKSFEYDVFKLAVEQQLMPLEKITTTKWSDYGESNVGLSPDTTLSVVYNSPIQHGFGDHFTDLFQTDRGELHKVEYVIEEVPQRPGIFVAMDSNRPQSITDPQELEPYVGTAGSKEQVEEWVEEYNNRDPQTGKAGVFGHVRRWELNNDLYVAELQSDFYQKNAPEKTIAELVVKNPKTEKQKKLAEQYAKNNDVINRTPVEIKKEYKHANSLVTNIRDLQSAINDVKKQEGEYTVMFRDPMAQPSIYSKFKIKGEPVQLKNDQGFKFFVHESVSKQDARKWRVSNVESGQFLTSGLTKEEAIKNAQEVIDSRPAKMLKDGIIEQTAIFKDAPDYIKIREEEIIQIKKELSELPDRTNRKQYEKYFNAIKEQNKLLLNEIPKSFTLIEKQFVAHRKNYSERMIREEIREAAKQGKDNFLMPTPHTIATIEGYIEGQAGGPYEILEAEDHEELETGDTIDYGGEEMTVITADPYSINVVPSDKLNIWSLQDFIQEEEDIAIDETFGELPDTVTLEDFKVDNWYFEISGAQVHDILESHIEQDESLDESSEVDIEDIRTEIEEKITENLQDKDRKQHLTYIYGEGKVNIVNDTIYVSEVPAEVFPQPSEFEGEGIVEPEDFDINDLDETYQGIVKKYEEHGEFLEKIKPESFKTITDSQGYEWYSVDIKSEDAQTAVQLFQDSAQPKGAVSRFELGETPIIKLFETADPSTFLHESGHTFFQFMNHAAVQPDAPQDLIDDWTALREHVGNDGTTPLTNDQHEILTKSLEAYFMEGKAPSARLQDVFQKFSNWLTSLYRQAFNLGVRPTKEVQAIFDRMFATDQEISDINQYYDAKRPFFEEADALAEQDRQRYERLRKKAEVTAEDKRFRRYVKSYVRSLGGKQEIEKQVAEQVNSMPVYTSMDKAVNDGGFFIGDVEELLGKDQRIALSKKRPGMVTIKGEVPIDIVAEENGFDSPTEMLNTMLAAEKKSDLQKKIVDRELVQIEKQIREGLEAADPDAPVADNDYHNDARLAVLAAEAQMLEQRKRLEKGREKAKAKRIEAKAVRDVAREVLKTKTLNDALGHYKYSRAEAKASRQAREAKDNGDIEAAEKFKRKELLNHALVLEAVKAREAHEKTIRRFARSIKRDIDDRYGNQIVGVLNKFGLTKRTPQDGTKDFATFMEGLTVADADNPMGPTSTPRWNDWAYNNTKVPKPGTTYRTTLTLAEFEELNDIVKWLTETGYDLKKGRLAAYKESMNELVNELIEPSKTLKYKKVYKKGSFLRKLSDNVRRFIADHDMFPFVLDMMDGFTNTGPKGYFGPNRIKIGHVLADRQSARDRRMKSAFEGLDAPISTLTESSKKHSKQIETTVPVPELINRDGDYWTFEKIISIALNMGNPTNLQRLQDGYGLSMSDLAELTSLLSKEDWKAVQTILDHVDSYWKDLDDVHYRVNHFHQERVKAQPIEVRTSEGDEFTLKGGYYPLKYDSNLAKRVAEWDEKDDLMQETVWGHPGVKAGHLKSRASNVFLPVNLSLSTLYSHIEDVVHYITHADVIKDIDRVTQSGEYQEAMEDKLGVEVYRLIRPTLRHIARPERALGTFIDKKLDRMRALSTAYILGVNTSVAVKQIFSVPGVIFKTGIGAYTKGIWRVIRNPIEARESMREMSPYMETRSKSFDRDIKDSLGKLRFAGMGLKPGMADQVRDWGFVLIRMMDFTAVYPAWWGSYKQGLTKENNDPEAATRYADEMIRDTQPSSKPMDLSNIQRNRNGLVRAFSMFMTFTAKYGNRQRFHYKGWRQGKIKTTEYGRHLLYEAILPPLLMNMMFAFMWGDDRDEEEAAGDILTDIMMYQFSGYVLVRELAGLGGYLVKKYGLEDEDVFKPDVARAPAFEGFRVGQRSAETLVKWLNDMDDDENYEKAVWAFAEFASFWVGIPAPKLARKLLEGMRQFEEGEGTAFNIAVPNPSKRER